MAIELNEFMKVGVKFHNLALNRSILTCPLDGLINVEQLIRWISTKLEIGPVYCYLFGLRLVESQLWLPPNYSIEEMISHDNRKSDEPYLEFLMRFKPASVTKLMVADPVATRMIYSQLRHEFLNTNFDHEKADRILLDDTIFCLVAYDMLRSLLETQKSIDVALGKLNLSNFIPSKVPRWQKTMLSYIRGRSRFRQSVKIGGNKSRNNIYVIQQRLIRTFLQEICPDYGEELYNIVYYENAAFPQLAKLRIRHHQYRSDSYCLLEVKIRNLSKSVAKWVSVCGIDAITSVVIHSSSILILHDVDTVSRFEFDTSLHARSFLSSIDGYNRLMRKWYFNISKGMSSQHLRELRDSDCFGPIGSAAVEVLLPTSRKPGSFLIRECMHFNGVYMIDIILPLKTRMIIRFKNNKNNRFIILDHSVSKKKKYQVISRKLGYVTIKELIEDIQICKAEIDDLQPLQLINWITPSENDDCMNLLLAMPKKTFKELDYKFRHGYPKTIELPKRININELEFHDNEPLMSGNMMMVRFARLQDQVVIVKSKIPNEDWSDHFEELRYIDFRWNQDKDRSSLFLEDLKPGQVMMAEWVTIKHPLFAETFGVLSNNSLVQAYFPLGSLDEYLRSTHNIRVDTIESICSQFAKALMYLRDRRIVHGKIRCRNAFVSQVEPMQIKVSDPLGAFDSNLDHAYLAPESFHRNSFYSTVYRSGIDVWALGTTLWQIYSNGVPPPMKTNAGLLLRPSNCPCPVWEIIESCWIPRVYMRAKPNEIFRDLTDFYLKKNYFRDRLAKTEAGIASENRKGMDGATDMSDIHAVPLTRLRGPGKSFRNGNCDPNSNFKSPRPKGLRTHVLKRYRDTFNKQENRRDDNPFQLAPVSRIIKRNDTNNLNESKECIVEIDSNIVVLGIEIGRGACGVVMKGSMKSKIDGHEKVVAVKRINKDNIDLYHKLGDLKREHEILASLDHKNIIKTYGFSEVDMLLAVEYLPLGSLLHTIRDTFDGHVDDLPLLDYAIGIARGMEYLESKHVVHRDLALRNILIAGSKEVKICDFGLARSLETEEDYYISTNRALPIKWYPPETITLWTFTHKSDVWSYGVVLWEIYSGGLTPHYPGLIENLIVTLKTYRLLQPIDCPDRIYKLMLGCWAYEPKDRISFDKICQTLDDIRTA